MKQLTLVLCLVLSQTANAAPWVSLRTTGGDGYSAVEAGGGLPLGERWTIWLRADSARSADIVAGELRFGADFKVTERLTPTASLVSRTEPGDIRGLGGLIGLSWNFPSLGDDFLTTLIFEGETIRYWQTVASRATLRLAREDVLVQRAFTFGLHQEISERWSITLNATGYSYDQDPEIWSDAVLDRYARAHALMVPVRGFPRSNSSLGVQYLPLQELQLSLTLIATRGSDDTRGDGAVLGAQYMLEEHWSFEAQVSSSQTEGTRNGGLGSLGASYFF
ncbi:MAG: hypothetical protein ABL958_10670 [Bdellovibrionia bacterium]